MKIIILFLSLSIKLDSQSITEMMSSYQIFDHPKAKGVNFSLKAPNGWECKEGDRPNIVKKFEWGTNVYSILIKDNETFFSKNKGIGLFKNEENVRRFINNSFNEENFELINYKIVSVDKFPALEIILNGQVERLGMIFKYRLKQWIILYEDKLVLITGICYNRNDFNKFEPLFNLITATFVFPDQYK
jgi:hypothetical protein